MSNPSLAALSQRLHAISNQSVDLWSQLSDEQWVTRPSEVTTAEGEHVGSWSVAECFDHLTVLNQDYVRLLEQVYASAPTQPVEKPYGKGLVMRLFIQTQAPPVKRGRVKVPLEGWQPRADLDPAVVRTDFLHIQTKLAEIINQGENYALNRMKFTSPALKILRMNAFEALAMLVTDEERHLWQAQRVYELVLKPEEVSL